MQSLLEAAGLAPDLAQDYARKLKEQEIDIDTLSLLTRDEMREMGIIVIGHQLKIKKAGELAAAQQSGAASTGLAGSGLPGVLRNTTLSTSPQDDLGSSARSSSSRPAAVSVTPASVSSLRRVQQQQQRANEVPPAVPPTDPPAYDDPAGVSIPAPPIAAHDGLDSFESVSRMFDPEAEEPQDVLEGISNMGDEVNEVNYDFDVEEAADEGGLGDADARRGRRQAGVTPSSAVGDGSVPPDILFFETKDKLEAALKLDRGAAGATLLPILKRLKDIKMPAEAVQGTNLVDLLKEVVQGEAAGSELFSLARECLRPYAPPGFIGSILPKRPPASPPSSRRRAAAAPAPLASEGGTEEQIRASLRKAIADALTENVHGITVQAEKAAESIVAELWKATGGDPAKQSLRLEPMLRIFRDAKNKDLCWAVARNEVESSKAASLSEKELEDLARSLEERQRRGGERKRPLSPPRAGAARRSSRSPPSRPRSPPRPGGPGSPGRRRPRSPTPPGRRRSPSPARKRPAILAGGGFSAAGPVRAGARSPPRGPRSPPRGGARSPPRGARSPPRGGARSPPRAGRSPPRAGGRSPPRGGARSPPRGARGSPMSRSPLRGGRSPPRGPRSPPRGARSPPRGARSPLRGARSPPRGGRSPPRGPRSPPPGGRSPPRGGRSPPRGQPRPRSPPLSPPRRGTHRSPSPAPRPPPEARAPPPSDMRSEALAGLEKMGIPIPGGASSGRPQPRSVVTVAGAQSPSEGPSPRRFDHAPAPRDRTADAAPSAGDVPALGPPPARRPWSGPQGGDRDRPPPRPHPLDPLREGAPREGGPAEPDGGRRSKARRPPSSPCMQPTGRSRRRRGWTRTPGATPASASRTTSGSGSTKWSALQVSASLRTDWEQRGQPGTEYHCGNCQKTWWGAPRS